MELWIRSQDRMKLFRGIDFRGVVEQDGCSIIDNTDDYIIGTYKSIERALEVLDEIQSKLKQQFIVKADGLISRKDIDMEENRLTWKYDKEFIMQDSGFEIIPVNSNVLIYEMPKE